MSGDDGAVLLRADLRFRAVEQPADRGELGQHRARLDAQRQALDRAATAAGWRFGTHDTGLPPGQALMWLHGVLAG